MSCRTRRPWCLCGAVRCRVCITVRVDQPADHVADVCHLCGLCGDLTVILKAAHAPEHRYWRCLGAMPPVLGWSSMTGIFGPEALILFLIIFCGPRRTSGRWRCTGWRTTASQACPCCLSPTATSSRACRSFVHADSFCGMPHALRVRHGSWLYLALCRGAERGILRLWICLVAQLLRRPGPKDLPLS